MIEVPEDISSEEQALADQIPEGKVITEADVRRLAHLPLLTIFYLSLQRQVSSTPVTALELAAYLGIEVSVMEPLLEYLERQRIVRAFREDIPAYSLGMELNEITVKDLMELLGEYQLLLKENGKKVSGLQASESNEKYRKIYSDLASEILQLFGEESANTLPL